MLPLTIQHLLQQHISDREIADANLKGSDNWTAQVSLLNKCVSTMVHLHLKTSAQTNKNTQIHQNNSTETSLCNGASALKYDDTVVSLFQNTETQSDENIITHLHFDTWYQDLSYYQQQKAKYAVERFVNFLMFHDHAPGIKFNPFSNGEGKTYGKKKPSKERARLTIADFNKIRKTAEQEGYQWMVNAMELAYLLKLRRADILTLKFKDYDTQNKVLTKQILKSVNQKGEDQAVTMRWCTSKRGYATDAVTIINKARKTRTMDIGTKTEVSPYIIHERPQRMHSKPAKGKTHHSQVKEERLSKVFKKLVDLNPDIVARANEKGLKPPTFHEIRSLSTRLDLDKGMDLNQLSQSLAHSSTKVTQVYIDGIKTDYVSGNRLKDLV